MYPAAVPLLVPTEARRHRRLEIACLFVGDVIASLLLLLAATVGGLGPLPWALGLLLLLLSGLLLLFWG